jgi:hypothetical protein
VRPMTASKWFSRAAVLAAPVVFAAPTVAAAGFIDLTYQSVDWNISGESAIEATTAGGVLSFGLDEAMRVQLGAQTTSTTMGDFDADVTSLDAHLNYAAQDWNLGVYANWSQVDVTETRAVHGVGVEGTLYFDRVMISGSIGRSWNEGFSSVEIWDAALQAKYFVTDNLSVAAKVSELQFRPNFDEEVTAFAVHAEYRLPDCGASVFGGYRTQEYSSPGLTATNDGIEIGLRWSFGAQSLWERERAVPSLTRGNAMTAAGFVDL